MTEVNVLVTVWCNEGDHDGCKQRDYFLCKCDCHLQKLGTTEFNLIK